MTTRQKRLEYIRVECRGRTGILTLDRPGKANAYHGPMLEEFLGALRELHDDAEVRVLVIASAGKHFCAGADLEEIRSRRAENAFDLKSAAVFDELAMLPEISIAAIQGGAIGGGLELALACDLRVATPTAFFGLPEVSHGLIPAAGGTYRLARLVGLSRAKALILGGKRVDGETALQWGLVNDLVSDQRLLDDAMAWAARIARNDGLALQLAKQALDAAGGIASDRHTAQLSQALLYELANRDRIR